MEFFIPPDLYFLERGFCRSDTESTGAPLYLTVSEFVRKYHNDFKLVLLLCPSGNSLEVTLSAYSAILCQIYLDAISQIVFQSWDKECIIRIYTSIDPNHRCIRIHYDPFPRIVIEAT